MGNNRKKEEKKRPKVGDNNGQATHGARKHTWRTQTAWAKIPAFIKIMVTEYLVKMS